MPTDKYLTLTETEVAILLHNIISADNIPFAMALSIQHAYVQTRYWHWQGKANLSWFLTAEDVNFIDALASVCFSYVLRRCLLTEDAVTWRFWEHNTHEMSSNENTKSKLTFYDVNALVHACWGADVQTGAVLSVKAKSSSKEAVSGLQMHHWTRVHIQEEFTLRPGKLWIVENPPRKHPGHGRTKEILSFTPYTRVMITQHLS